MPSTVRSGRRSPCCKSLAYTRLQPVRGKRSDCIRCCAPTRSSGLSCRSCHVAAVQPHYRLVHVTWQVLLRDVTPGPVGQAHEGGPYGFQAIRVYVIPHIRAVTVIADFTIIAAAVHQSIHVSSQARIRPFSAASGDLESSFPQLVHIWTAVRARRNGPVARTRPAD